MEDFEAMNDTFKLKDFHTWLKENHPGEGEVMVCKLTKPDQTIEWFLCEYVVIANGIMFLLNHKFFYDYEFLWNDENKWEIVWKSK